MPPSSLVRYTLDLLEENPFQNPVAAVFDRHQTTLSPSIFPRIRAMLIAAQLNTKYLPVICVICRGMIAQLVQLYAPPKRGPNLLSKRRFSAIAIDAESLAIPPKSFQGNSLWYALNCVTKWKK